MIPSKLLRLAAQLTELRRKFDIRITLSVLNQENVYDYYLFPLPRASKWNRPIFDHSEVKIDL